VATIKKYLWVAHLFVIAVCSYFIAQTVTTYISMMFERESTVSVTAKERAKEEQTVLLSSVSDYETIVNRNIFNSEEVPVDLAPPPDDEVSEPVDTSGSAVKTTLNIKVLGTLVVDGGNDRRSSATVVGGKSRKPGVFFVGGLETFEEGVELIKVKKYRIEFVNKGRLEYAILEGVKEELTIFAKSEDVHGKEDKKGPRKDRREESREIEPVSTDKSPFVIDQREVDEALSNLDRLYTEIRIVPNFRNGQPAGMKILAVKPGSIFSKLGLKRGDVLERINGLELDIRRGMELFSQLREQKNLRIDLVRRGINKTLEYEIR
jgi:general secretion pathway protein C